jgi:hypothetical protein
MEKPDEVGIPFLGSLLVTWWVAHRLEQLFLA